MKTVQDKLWLWGHPAGSYNGEYKLEETSTISITEAANYLGVSRTFMVVYKGIPQPPFDKTSKALVGLKEVKYSIVGDESSIEKQDGDVDEVIRQSEKFDNITGGIFDDFYGEKRLEIYTPSKIESIRNKMHEKNLDLWCVYYATQVNNGELLDRLQMFDGFTFWTYSETELKDFEKNYAEFLKQTKGKRRMIGCYLYDFSECHPLSKETMEFQLNRYLKALKLGEVEGIVFCASPVIDMDLEAVEYTRNWIREHGGETI